LQYLIDTKIFIHEQPESDQPSENMQHYDLFGREGENSILHKTLLNCNKLATLNGIHI